jgi:Domain of unknown function DUF29
MRTNSKCYDQDFAVWIRATAALVRAGQWDDLDREVLAEELESVGKSQQQALESHLEIVLTHLLTCGYGPTLPDVRRGWRLTIREQRRRLAHLLHHNPSLRPTVPAVVTESYPHARLMALDATEEPSTTFPETCPWTPEQVLDAEFWPEGERPPVRRMGFNA